MPLSDYAFGIDISKYDSNNGLMDFAIVANHEPKVTFIAARAGISWGYEDPMFSYHWQEIGKMDKVGRMAYHVLYPGEPAQKQVDNLFKAIGDNADWEHDRLVIDAELQHQSSPAEITQTINQFGALCKDRTGRLPILYSRYYWLRDHTKWQELYAFDMWLAQYNYANPYPYYTAEREPPPTHFGERGWLIHQTASNGKPIGVTGNKHYMDYDRWNGSNADVLEYFGYSYDNYIPIVTTPSVLEARLTALEGRVDALEEKCQ